MSPVPMTARPTLVSQSANPPSTMWSRSLVTEKLPAHMITIAVMDAPKALPMSRPNQLLDNSENARLSRFAEREGFFGLERGEPAME